MADSTTAGNGVTTLPADPVTSGLDPLPADIKGALNIALVQIVSAGVVAHENFITVNKMLDLDYLENRRSIDPKEAAGLKELDTTTASKPA
jgi:hypothetical protein